MPRIRRLLPFAAAAAAGAAIALAAVTLSDRDGLLGGDEAQAAAPQQIAASGEGPTVTFHLPPIGATGPLATVADCLRDEGVDLTGDTDIDVTEDGVTIDGDRVDEAKLRSLAMACWPAALDASGVDAGALGDLGDLGSRLRELLQQLQDFRHGG
jgi:hypothetical protein